MNGIRVLDLTRVLAGPWAAMQLADQGAQVIKVEPPGGDETRGFGPLVDGHSTYFLSANRNKRAVTLDLRTAQGQEIIQRLVGRSDVLMENFRPGVSERLGLGFDDLHARHPRLIYVAICAFGADGDPAWTSRPGYDLVLQCMGGGAHITGPANGPPHKHGNSMADLLAALYAVQGVLLALLEREKTGKGQKIVINMMQVQAACLTYHASRYAVTGEVARRRGNTHGGLVPYRLFRCLDGWLSVGIGNDAMWSRLCTALEIPDRPEWGRNIDRVAHREAVDGVVQAALTNLTVARADALLAAARVPAGPVHTPDEVMHHPTVEMVEVDHPVFGRVALPGPALRTTRTITEHSAPPLENQHRDQILAEIGYTTSEIQEMIGQQVFG